MTVPVAAGSILIAGNESADPGAGCVIFPGLVPLGSSVKVAAGQRSTTQPSLEDCWRLCTETPPCNVFAYCDSKVRLVPRCWRRWRLGVVVVWWWWKREAEGRAAVGNLRRRQQIPAAAAHAKAPPNVPCSCPDSYVLAPAAQDGCPAGASEQWPEPFGGCELRRQPATAPGSGWPVAVLPSPGGRIGGVFLAWPAFPEPGCYGQGCAGTN